MEKKIPAAGIVLLPSGFSAVKEFDLITFDCYGTLIDWETGIFEAFRDEPAKDGRWLERGSVIDGHQICCAVCPIP